MTRPRVILVEDDAAVRRFVTLALEELPIELVACDRVAPALVALAQAPACLVLTDLMLPGEPGEALVRRLAADPRLRGPARVAVFSAGLTPELRQRLAGLGVWRLLSKPVSLAELEGCVREALNGAVADARPASGPGASAANTADGAPAAVTDQPAASARRTATAAILPGEGPGGETAHPAGPAGPAGDPAHPAGAAAATRGHADVVATYFGGDAALYAAYRATCQAQFTADCRAGDAALAAADWPALRRLAHSLKTVLLTLGESQAGAQAASLEAVCARTTAAEPEGEHAQAAARLWPALRDRLVALAAASPAPN